MGPENGINLEKVSYFPLRDYIDKIELSRDVKYHMDDTSEDFDKYISKLMKYDKETILKFLISAFNEEMQDSNKIESHIIHPKEINEKNIFFDSLNISHKRIKDLHQFVTDNKVEYDYRKDEVRVSYIDKKTNKELIYWYGVEPKDVKRFMDDYIEVYKTNSMGGKNNNPLIKSSLVHLLLTRIHPFIDGNGRTARIIQNMKFTESINKIYGYKLKISPLHLSQSICVNQPTYCKRLNDIYFDLENDNNDEINRWFEFCLNMFDEQIYFMSNQLDKKEDYLKQHIKKEEEEQIKVLSKKIKLK